MEEFSVIGLDLAKHVFQVHCIPVDGSAVVRRRLHRSGVVKFFSRLRPVLIGMEACGAAHYWARILRALGHEVRLLPPVDVKAFVRRGSKNDARDAEAIAEATLRPHICPVPVKTVEQQGAQILHRVRRTLVIERTQMINVLRSHCAELGIVMPLGEKGLKDLCALLDDDAASENALPRSAGKAFGILIERIAITDREIAALDKEIVHSHRSDPVSRRLAEIPGVGPLIAQAMITAIGDPHRFRNGRCFAAWLGLVPAQNSSGGKERLGRITKRGDRLLRSLLVIGATSTLTTLRRQKDQWTMKMLERKPARLVTVAIANRTARIIWAMLANATSYEKREKTAV